MNLALYSARQEENIDIRKQAQTWKRSGLITDDQLHAIHDDTEPQVRQTNLFFRVLFFIFTLLGAGALTGLFVWLAPLRNGGDVQRVAALLILFSVVFYLAAESIVRKRRLYRYGIEEGLAMTAMVLFCAGCALLLHEIHPGFRSLTTMTAALFAVAAFWIHLRFGFLYAAGISIVAICVIPFQLFTSPVTGRLVLLSVLCAIFVFSLIAGKPDIHDFGKNRRTTIQAGLMAAIYLTVNLQALGLVGLLLRDAQIFHLYPKLFPPPLYWSSYLLTFIFPAAGIFWGIKSRKRLILNASLAMACVTLATNKSYLGMTRYAWDPAILGVVLVALSLVISRWLSRGPDQRRAGFTAENILKPEDQGISLADAAAALAPGAIEAQQPSQAPQDKLFEGGQSGGGGASREF